MIDQTARSALSFSPAVSRRSLFRLGLAGGALAATPLAAQLRSGFTHGVASGEPGSTSMLLWTRYVAAQPTALQWEVATDDSFACVVAGGTVEASAARDGCVKPVATGLDPATRYSYRFIAPDGAMSATGRTRTLPVGKTSRFRMAVFGCSNIGYGWFNAYAHAAAAGEFDLAVHTGDYLYEYARGTYPGADAAVRAEMVDPLDEIVTLADYRARHAAYRDDPDLLRLHQLLPMVATWDDHESTNDSWRDGAQNHQPATEGSWDVRKAAAKQAYREWMPVSDEPWASYDIGDLATLFRVDSRLEGRDEAPDLAKILSGVSSTAEAFAALTTFRDGAWRDPARSMYGPVQEAWLEDGIAASSRGGKRWQVLVNQTIMGTLGAATSLLDDVPASVPADLRRRLQAASGAARTGLPLNFDAWDGYPAARARLLTAALDADANLVVLTGDSHNGWAFELAQDSTPAGVEFAGQSVTSPGFETYLPWVAPDRLARELVAANKQLAWANTGQRGYMAVELTPDAASSEWRFSASVKSRDASVTGSHRQTAAYGSRRLTG